MNKNRNMWNKAKLGILTSVIAVSSLMTACEKPTDEPDNPEPPVVITDTKTFTIASFVDIATQLPEINKAAEVKSTKVIINVKKMGVTAAQLKTVREFTDGQRLKANVELKVEGFWALEKDVEITFAEWEKLGKPALFADAGFKFKVSAADKKKFEEAGYANMVETGGNEPPVGQTVNITVANSGELAAKCAEAATAAAAGKAVVLNGEVLVVKDADMANLQKLVHDKITVNFKITAGAEKVTTTAAVLKKIKQFSNGKYNSGNMFFVPGVDVSGKEGAADLIGADVQVFRTDTASYGKDGAKLTVMVPAKMFWNVHGANAEKLALHKDYPGKIPTETRKDTGLPGGQAALGNMTDDLFWLIEAGSTKPDGSVYIFNGTPIVTTFMLDKGAASDRDWGIGGTGGIPAAPARIKTLGDGGVTNYSFSFLMDAWYLVNTRGSTAGQKVVPQIESANADGKIYFESGRHFVDPNDNNRSNYMPEWFANRKNWFKFAVQNDLKIVIEMDKITFKSLNIGGTTEKQLKDAAYNQMVNAFPSGTSIELPTADVVKALLSNQTTRGP